MQAFPLAWLIRVALGSQERAFQRVALLVELLDWETPRMVPTGMVLNSKTPPETVLSVESPLRSETLETALRVELPHSESLKKTALRGLPCWETLETVQSFLKQVA